MQSVLEKINSPADVKKLSIEEMTTLSQEIREAIIKKVNTTGGHMAPNLGIVETTIALHYVFDSPKDKIIYDVSHQCYTHKCLTGRKESFTTPETYLKYSGYTNPEESEHDLFVVGHTSTSVSLATGVAKARDLKGEAGNVIALIGDGSLSGGEAFEGLDNSADLNSNIIILVNDNEMSIAENHGGLYGNLKLLRETKGKAECNFFKSLGFEYLYLENGHDFNELIQTFNNVKDTKHPVVIHLHTTKGKGLPQAEENKEKFHWVSPGILDEKTPVDTSENYTTVTKEYILNKIKQDKTVLAISAATPGAYGFTPDYRAKLGKNYTDVGIAEEHGIAFASAMAKCGAKPIFPVLSSFVQRTYDQLSQDLCLNNSPATLLVYWGGISGADMTHLGCFDIPLISNIPNMVYLAPTCKEEYLAMLDWAVEQTNHPVAIRVPFNNFIITGKEYSKDYSNLNKYLVEQQGKDIAIIGVGDFFELGKKVANILKDKGISATLINPRYITGIDTELLNQLKESHKIVITLENGILNGGFGEKIASFYGDSDIKVLNFSAKKEFTDREPLDKLYEKYHLTPELIVQDIEKVL